METIAPGSEEERIIGRLEEHILAYVQDVNTANNASAVLPPMHHRDAFIAATAHSLLLAGDILTKRDVYYLVTALFGNQSNADAAVERVALAVECHRNDLNIVAAPKSLVAGSLSFVSEDDHLIHVAGFGPAGLLIPARPERIKNITTSALFVLVCVPTRCSAIASMLVFTVVLG